MTITSARLEQVPVDEVNLVGTRPVASLGVRPEDLRGITWTEAEDDAGGALVAILETPDGRFGLEAAAADPKQVTVYGTTAGEALTELIACLGLHEDQVLDRVDAEFEAEPSLPDFEATVVDAAADMERRVEEMAEGLRREFATPESDRTKRKAAAAAVELSELTTRQRQILVLFRDGLTVGEISDLLAVGRETVQRHIRAGLKSLPQTRRWSSEG